VSDYRDVLDRAVAQLTSQGDIAKFGTGTHGVNACTGKHWDCLGNMICRIAGRMHLGSMAPLFEQLSGLISELFPGREIRRTYDGDPAAAGFAKVYLFNDHADTTLADELLLLGTWLERHPQ
jgi:hypothetical protein